MNGLRRAFLLGAGGILALTVATGRSAGEEATAFSRPAKVLRLEDLEERALRNNPTVGQADAALQAAEGLREQAGLYPNPLFGYEITDLTGRRPRRHKQFLFLEQTFVTAGKIRHGREVADQEAVQAKAGEEAQRQRVRTLVRLLYYEALGAARLVELRADLARLTREAVGISEELFNVGQADRPDVLAAEIEAERADLDLARARTTEERIWQMLAAAVGDASLSKAPLAGDLEAAVPELDENALVAEALGSHPEVKVARAGVERARAALERANAKRYPDLTVRGGVGYSFQETRSGQDEGTEGFLVFGVPLPVFDRNQGGIAAARADLDRAEREVTRQELSLRSRFSSASQSFRDSLRAAETYHREVLPRAKKAYDLYLKGFREMAAAYPQVLIAQRTLGQMRVEYIQALVETWQGAALLRGSLLTAGLGAPGLTPGGGDPIGPPHHGLTGP